MIELIEFFEFNLILFTSIVLIFIFFFLLIFFPLKESKNKQIDKAKINLKSVPRSDRDLDGFEDFVIFTKNNSNDDISTNENITMQEKLKDLEIQMLKLKNLYITNSITKQEYVDDTRKFYNEAKKIFEDVSS